MMFHWQRELDEAGVVRLAELMALRLKPGNIVTNGPYAEIKEILGGLSIIRAESMEEAAEIAKNCPILSVGGNVEVREIIPMNS